LDLVYDRARPQALEKADGIPTRLGQGRRVIEGCVLGVRPLGGNDSGEGRLTGLASAAEEDHGRAGKGCVDPVGGATREGGLFCHGGI
jgi:hypothetical protein